MRITRPRATKLSQITIDTGLDMGPYNITLDGKDVSTKINESEAHIAAVKPHSGHAVITSGNYDGNDTVNRAIAHGLGKVPKLVMTFWYSASYNAVSLIVEGDVIVCVHHTGVVIARAQYAITEWDATNFYVGNASEYDESANGGDGIVYWAAIG